MGAPSKSVILVIQDNVARVSLNNPSSLNAMTVELANDFLEAMRAIEASKDVRVVLIQGQGRAFCAGGDLSYLANATPQTTRVLIDPLHEAIEILTNLPVPVVVALHGVVAGAGVSLAMACDLALAAEGTRFNLAYAGIGTSPDASASWHLPRLVGFSKSLELLLLCEPFDAAEALRLGLLYRVVPGEDLGEATEALIAKLTKAATFALGQTKQLVRKATQRTLHEQLNAERDSFCACVKTEDFANGVNAFLSKQKPSFIGR